MGIYTDDLPREVRLEYMRPAQVDEAKAGRAAAYVPFGSLEWHGRQNALGLDALKAHEQLVALALRAGGVVLPPVYFGSAGGHGDYPYTCMFSPEPTAQLVAELLEHLQSDGFESVILLSGHYPNRTQFLEPAVEAYRGAGGTMRVLAIVENQVPDGVGDHAAMWETSFMLHLHPRTVDLSRLAGHDEDRTGPDERRNFMTEVGPDHPCWGLVGVDPRANATSDAGRDATDRLLDALTRWLDGGDIWPAEE
jgi:creatinine amidohydrolase